MAGLATPLSRGAEATHMIIQDKPKLSVVIVNYFSERSLVRCLRSIENQSDPIEVIVVDNGSQQRRWAGLLAAHPAVVWHSMGTNAGFSAACNAGASRARSRKLLFLNPDTRVLAGSLGALARALDSREYSGAILGCAVYNGDGSVQLSCRRFPNWKTFFAGRFSLLTRLFPANSWSAGYLMGDFDRQSVRRVDWVSGAALAMRKSTFERLGGFDERFFVYFEDVDLCHRAADMGIPTCYLPEARVEHVIGGSSRGVPYRALAYRHRSMWTYYKHHLRYVWLDPFALTVIYGRLAALVAIHALAQLAVPSRTVSVGAPETTE